MGEWGWGLLGRGKKSMYFFSGWGDWGDGDFLNLFCAAPIVVLGGLVNPKECTQWHNTGHKKCPKVVFAEKEPLPLLTTEYKNEFTLG